MLLTDCAGDDFPLYGVDWCGYRATVLVLVAGWCGPAIQLSDQLPSSITAPYRARGVRVISVIISTEDYSAPDEDYCTTWRDRFDLAGEVVIDPLQLTNVHAPSGTNPATIVLDDTGTVRARIYGTSDELTEITRELDAVLAGDGG